MVVKSGAKITLMAEEPSFLSVCQLASNVYDRGPISASSHLASGSVIQKIIEKKCQCLPIPRFLCPGKAIHEENDSSSSNEIHTLFFKSGGPIGKLDGFKNGPIIN